ncbi:hypothetical protein AQ768_07050 [Burkholderia pseudomallei]|nr:hypothetical protein AQ768_07050 [Burkholderia pseudomallei]ONB86447.1 hypothetical protein AQ907_00025 [Burkholderia pseudomallei]
MLNTLTNLLINRHIDTFSDFQRDAESEIDRLSQSPGVGQTVYPHYQVLIGNNRNRAPAFKYLMLKRSHPGLSSLYVNSFESQRIGG